MTEVRKVFTTTGDETDNQWGVFATRRFEVGEVIFREAVPWKLTGGGDGAAHDDDDDDQCPANEHRIGAAYQKWLKDLPMIRKNKTATTKEVKQRAAEEEEDAVVVATTKTTRSIRAQDCFKKRKNKADGTKKQEWTTTEQSKLACMLLSILRFVDETMTSAEERQWLLNLYHPSLAAHDDDEQKIIELSRSVLEWLDEHVVDEEESSITSSSSSTTRTSNPLARALRDNRASLQRIALVWACNAFAGGRIYQLHSRLNHSCQPNAVVQTQQPGGVAVTVVGSRPRTSTAATIDTKNNKNNSRTSTTNDTTDDKDNDKQWIRATATIEPGQEITISYLPIEFLYSETSFRRSILRQTKHFHCKCTRCSACPPSEEFVTAIPCLQCHPRTRQGMLDEDVQYDDDYANDDEAAGGNGGVHYAWMVTTATAAVQDNEASTATTTATTATRTEYRCSSCRYVFPKNNSDDDRSLCTHQIVSGKIAAFLESYQHQESIVGGGGGGGAANSNVLMEYASLSSSVHGALFWTTNVLLYYQLDASLQEYHRGLLADTSQEPDLDQVAEFIDMLQRLCRFVKHARLSLHRGHWLGDVIVGTARALVALGDRKSQKYASDWLTEDDFGTFVQRFEPNDLQTVVERLRTAWSRCTDDPSADDNATLNKRQKAGR